MHRTPRISHLTVSIAALLIGLAACSRPTEISSTWHEERASGAPYMKVLVVGVSESAGQRRRFENAMAAALEAAGNTTAWPSHRNMPTDAPLTRDSVAKVVESTGADAVIVTRLIDHEVVGEEVKARTGVKTNPKGQKVYNFFRYDYDEYEEAGYLVVKSTVTLSTDLYETGQGGLIYSVDTTTYEKESGYEIIDEATRAIARRLHNDRLVR